MLYTLSLGSLLAAFICWAISLLEIYHANGTINDLFTQPYAYHFLSGRVGVHTPYLGLFVSVSIFYLLLKAFEASSKKRTLIHLIWASILFLFLLNLLARTALISLSLGLVAFFLYRRKYILVFAVMAAIASLATIVYVQEQNFLRDRLLNSINIFEEQTIFSKKDDRFHRFKASIEVFKEFPLLGPGTASEDPYRKAVYYDNRDSEAYNENYNAHNQFLEYLSTFGILGGVTFLWIIYVLLKDSFGTKDVFSVFLVFSFIMASLTESVLERSWGISFYLLLLFCIYGNKLIPNEMD
ncbi:MAG: O-antigen ligase family protein [Flavobacteriaceae bacterium]